MKKRTTKARTTKRQRVGRRTRPLRISPQTRKLLAGIEAKEAKQKQKRRKQTEHARIASEASYLYKKIQKAEEQGFYPVAFSDFAESYEKFKTSEKKDYSKLQEAVKYTKQSDSFREYEANKGSGIFEKIREDFGRDTSAFWRAVKMLQDFGLSSSQAIDAAEVYNTDTGGKPTSVTLQEFTDAVYRYFKTREDIYAEAVKQTPWKSEDLVDISDLFDDFWS